MSNYHIKINLTTFIKLKKKNVDSQFFNLKSNKINNRFLRNISNALHLFLIDRSQYQNSGKKNISNFKIFKIIF